MEEARCGAILDEAIEELLTQVAKKEVKLQDQRIRRDQKKKVDVERLPERCARGVVRGLLGVDGGCASLAGHMAPRGEGVAGQARAPGGQTSPQRQGDRAPDRRSGDVQGLL